MNERMAETILGAIVAVIAIGFFVFAAAQAAGLSWQTVQRARAQLGVRAYKDGLAWFWELIDD